MLAANSRCHVIGFCVCNDDGRLLARLRLGFYRLLKKVCPIGSDNREALKLKMLIVKLDPSDTTPAVTSAWSDIAADSSDDGAAPEDSTCYWHIAGIRFSPYSIVARRMRYLRTEVVNGMEQTHLEACVCV